MDLARTQVVDLAESLTKAEWEVVHSAQSLVFAPWMERKMRFSPACCGILFVRNYAFASNGHWAMKLRTDGTFIDPSVTSLFYDYIADDVLENVNPFEKEHVPLELMFALFNIWKKYTVKVRVEDLIAVIEANFKFIRDRRYTAFHGGMDGDTNELGIRLEHKDDKIPLVRIPIYGRTQPEEFPEFCVNTSYLHKILEMLRPHIHLVELGFDGTLGESLLIKAKNPGSDKADMRFILGQYQT